MINLFFLFVSIFVILPLFQTICFNESFEINNYQPHGIIKVTLPLLSQKNTIEKPGSFGIFIICAKKINKID